MFAKPQKTSACTLLKTKDVRKLRKDLLTRFRANPALTEDLLVMHVLPNKCGIERHSFAAPSRVAVYMQMETREPVAFDISGRGDLCFSVYALWRAAELLPALVVHAPVSAFVLRGADVMLPGVVFADAAHVQTLRKTELRALYANGNPHAFAIGEMLVDAEEIAKYGMKGRAMRVLHVVGDELWKMGPQTVPNAGFQVVGAAKPRIVSLGGDEVDEVDAVDEVDSPDREVDEVDAALVDLTVDDDDEDKAVDPDELEEKPQVEPLSRADMDALYRAALLQALRSGRIKETQLPMLASTFHSSVLLPCRAAGTTLNIKQTTYKKLSVFLQAMAREGLVTVVEKDGVQSLTAIAPRHPEVLAHARHTTEEVAIQEQQAALNPGASAMPPPPGSYEPDVQLLLGLSPPLRTLLAQDPSIAAEFADMIGPTASKHWTLVQVRTAIAKYVTLAQLVDPTDRQFVRLNAPLTDALYTKRNAPPSGGYPLRLPRQDVQEMLLARCPKYHRVTLYPGHTAKIVAGDLQKLEIQAIRSKKHNSSTITILTHFAQFGIDGARFATDVQRKWGCRATTQMSDSKQRGEEIHIQGQMVNEALAYLASAYKLSTAKHCAVSYGKGVKAKKGKQ